MCYLYYKIALSWVMSRHWSILGAKITMEDARRHYTEAGISQAIGGHTTAE